MIKNICTYFLGFFSISLFSQTNLDVFFKTRLLFDSLENITDKNTEIIILETDTLYNLNTNSYDLSFLNDSLYNEKFLKIYNAMGFAVSNNKLKSEFELKQWNAPIVVYFDKQIPKPVVKQFETFYNQISNLEHLRIGFTSNIKKANYYIKTTSESINAYNEDFKFDSEIERENSYFTGATYLLDTDDNNKFYNGILTINIERGKSNMAILKQLKQLFFLSLGNFDTGFKIDESSLLSNNYKNTDTFSKFDLDLLKLHYSIIYPQKIDDRTFSKLMKLYKTQK
jgi:hypothetical protein